MAEEKRMKNPVVILGGVFFLVIVGIFYWFQYRPSQIRSSCAVSVAEGLQSAVEKKTTLNWQRTYDLYYESCLHKKGI